MKKGAPFISALALLAAVAAPSAQAAQAPPLVATAANPCAHRIFCGPLRIWPRSRSERALVLAQAAEIAMDATARARLRPLSVHFAVPSLPTSLAGPLAASGPPVAVGGGPHIGATALGIAATDLLDDALSRILRIPSRATDAENEARAIAAIDAGVVAIHRAARAEAQLRGLRDGCQRAIDGGSVPYPIVYAPAQGWGQVYSLPGYAAAVIWGAGASPCPAYQFVLPAGSIYQIPPISVAPYHSLDASIAGVGIGIDAASKVVPLAIRAGEWTWNHALPRNPSERRAFIFDAGMSLLDGLATSAGTAHGLREVDPFVRPFVRGGFAEIVGSWAIESAIARPLTRRWSPAQRAMMYQSAATQHFFGAITWDFHLDPYAYPVVIDGMAMPSSPYAPAPKGP